MRITNGMLVNNMMNNLNNNLNRMERYQQQGASGRLFDKPSDDPIGMSRSLKLYTDISKVEQYERNLNDANSWMHTTEEALREIEKILQRTRELSVEAANGPKTETDTKNIAEEIKQMKEQLIKLGNTRHAGRSIFTGFKTDKDLLKSPSGTYDISLNEGDESIYNVGISEDITVNIVGSRVFGFSFTENILDNNLVGDPITADPADSKEEAIIKERKRENLDVIKEKLKKLDLSTSVKDGIGDVDSYKELQDLIDGALDKADDIKKIEESLGIPKGSTVPRETGDPKHSTDPNGIDKLWFKIINDSGNGEIAASPGNQTSIIKMFDDIVHAMEKGDYDQISNHLDDIDREHKNILSITAEVGAKTNRLDMTEKRLSTEKLNFNTNLSKNEDVDFAELIMKSNLAQTIYQVSLSISGKVIQPTLLDFLR